MTAPSMPKATAKWLIENTALTFQQIADFCELHVIEVQGIADDEVAKGLQPQDPTLRGILTLDEIKRGEADDSKRLKAKDVTVYQTKSKRQTKYTPVARRQDKPNAIAWLVKYHPSIPDNKIVKLIGTTKSTIAAIRDRSHWNMKNITAKDPVLLGLCTQTDLNALIEEFSGQDQNQPF